MKAIKAFGIVSAIVALAQPGLCKTVGILKDARSGITEGIIKTIESAGW